MNAGLECKNTTGAGPNLIIVVLPDGGNDIYTAVKQYVDLAPCNSYSDLMNLALGMLP